MGTTREWSRDRHCDTLSQPVAADMGMGQSRVSEFIKELQGVGLIEITRRGQGKTNIYKLGYVVQKAPKRPKR